MDKKKVEALLISLGDTSCAVAESLRARGIKGKTQSPSCCPIAVLLLQEDPGVQIEVNGDDITYAFDCPHEDLEDGSCDCLADATVYPGKVIAAFIEEFDAGTFPDLIALEAPTEVLDLGLTKEES